MIHTCKVTHLVYTQYSMSVTLLMVAVLLMVPCCHLLSYKCFCGAAVNNSHATPGVCMWKGWLQSGKDCWKRLLKQKQPLLKTLRYPKNSYFPRAAAMEWGGFGGVIRGRGGLGAQRSGLVFVITWHILSHDIPTPMPALSLRLLSPPSSPHTGLRKAKSQNSHASSPSVWHLVFSFCSLQADCWCFSMTLVVSVISLGLCSGKRTGGGTEDSLILSPNGRDFKK